MLTYLHTLRVIILVTSTKGIFPSRNRLFILPYAESYTVTLGQVKCTTETILKRELRTQFKARLSNSTLA
uniref:Uncharacterized protein n=1 Tax=Pararge aegeria TaxID=116150 RepID=S4NWU1_9NEOP